MSLTNTADLAREFQVTPAQVRRVLRARWGSLPNPSQEWRLTGQQLDEARALLTERYGEMSGERFEPLSPQQRALNFAAVEEVARAVFEHARDGGSLFTDEDVFTDANFGLLRRSFIEAPFVKNGKGFFEKLKVQMDGLDDEAVLLFAEAFLLQITPLDQYRPATKKRAIETILSLAAKEYRIPELVIDGINPGIFGGGQRFSMKRYDHMVLILEILSHFREQPRDAQTAILEEPLTCAEFVRLAPGPSEPSMRNSIICQLHTSYFQPVVADWAREAIVETFAPTWLDHAPTGNADRDLNALDVEYTRTHGIRPDFYSPELKPLWDPPDESDHDPDEEHDTSVDDVAGAPLEVDGLGPWRVDDIIEEGCFYDLRFLTDLINSLREKNNLILQGAPGTGKTWLARQLADALAGVRGTSRVQSVQFHPGTTYEDFVRGWRPDSEGTLRLIDGPFLELAQRAADDPQRDYVMVIEEINRGNPAQAFGEMLTLLESTKRSEVDGIRLTYTRDDEDAFCLPPNLYVIGTMNIADRSLALVDFALRRRFAFSDLSPQLNEVWLRHVERQTGDPDKGKLLAVRSRVLELNRAISEDKQLGPSFQIGHSFVTPTRAIESVDAWYRRIVDREIIPLLHEYWIDDEDVIESHAARLRAPL